MLSGVAKNLEDVLIGNSVREIISEYPGAKGDLVFNTNYKQDAPFAWICLGAFRWSELKSA